MSDNQAITMQPKDVSEGIAFQAEHASRNSAPATGRIIKSLLPLMGGNTRCGERIREWPGNALEDAMPLRLTGGLHHLALTGDDLRLLPVYRCEVTDQASIDAIVADIVSQHDARLLAWFDSPPQTNEAGRSASFMAGLKWLSGILGPRFEMNELGASAGINTMMDRYHYNLNGVSAGPPSSPMQITPDWRGPPPPDNPVVITAIQGCDQAPIHLADPAAAMRVKSYIWPEMTERISRIDAAIKLASEQPPCMVKADAADWLEMRLNEPQQAAVTRVFHHSIVWQYIPEDKQQRISTLLTQAGKNASAERPLVWLMLETNRETFAHELIVRYWRGAADDGQPHLLGSAHAHGVWVEFNAG